MRPTLAAGYTSGRPKPPMPGRRALPKLHDIERTFRILAFSALLLLAAAGPARAALASGTWSPTGSLPDQQLPGGHTATALPDGRVLLAGGADRLMGSRSSTRLFYPTSGEWSAGGCLGDRRQNPVAVGLKDGRVLIAGGICQDSDQGGGLGTAEVYDPATGRLSPTGSPGAAFSPTAGVLLGDGRVLVVNGGESEIYDPAAADPATGLKGRFTATGARQVPIGFGMSLTTLQNGKVLSVGGALGGQNTQDDVEVYDPATGVWTQKAKLPETRENHVATVLANGKVLVAGGRHIAGFQQTLLASALIYDPTADTWTPTGSMTTVRDRAGSALLPSGKVLVVEGATTQSPFEVTQTAELYDPAAGTWTSTTNAPVTAHPFVGLTPLSDGRILVSGGDRTPELYSPAGDSFSPTAQAPFSAATFTALPGGKVLGRGSRTRAADRAGEIYDVTANSWTEFGPRGDSRRSATATLLASGKVLIAGGVRGDDVTLDSAELYDPATGFSTETGSLATPRSGATETRLGSGKVLVAGGRGQDGQRLDSAELYDPATGAWSPAGNLGARSDHTASLLPSGRVLVVGGLDAAGDPTDSAELYDPSSNSWAPVGHLPGARSRHTATTLADGRVLVVGGKDGGGTPLASAELYREGGGWTQAPDLPGARFGHTANLLPGGRVLVAGGTDADGSDVTSSQLFDPRTGGWGPTGSLGAARSGHTATTTTSGRVLAIGGRATEDNTTEVYDPAAPPRGRFLPTKAPTEGTSRLTLLPNGKVIATGGGDTSQRAELFNPRSERWSGAAPLTAPHGPGHTATLLADGRLLVAGEEADASEIYDWHTNAWTTTGAMTASRTGPAAALLGDGRVLAVGGTDFLSATTETFDPATGNWTARADSAIPRGDQSTAASLTAPGCGAQCGKVLLAGGSHPLNRALLELFDPASDTFDSPGTTTAPRSGPTATRLLNGRVLIVSGGTAEVYDPTRPDTVATGDMHVSRSSAPAALLPDGEVLITGGHVIVTGVTSSAELWDPATGKWRFTGSTKAPRDGALATSLGTGPYSTCGHNCGKVLVYGGDSPSTAELYTPQPRVAGISVASGPVSGGTKITITGHGLAAADRVSFGSSQAASFTPDAQNPEGKLTVIAPPHSAGTVDVRVESAGGISDKTAAYHYTYTATSAHRQLPAPRDTKSPALSGLRLTHKRFRAGSGLPRLARTAPVGTKIRFSLSEAADVKFSFTRFAPGRKVGRSCRAATRRLRHRPRCTRLAVVATKLVLKGRLGMNSVRFLGRLNRAHALRRGRYRLTAVATDAQGNHSRARRARFVMLPAHR